jgi:hypothetical protein
LLTPILNAPQIQ